MKAKLKKGLGSKWEAVVKLLEEIVPYYEKMNNIMSFGKDLVLREKGLRHTLTENDLVLDLGCGTGIMSQIAIKNDLAKNIVLVDVLSIMLLEAKKRVNGSKLNFILSVFENLPFREDVFDVVVCGFSIRDALDMDKAYSEILRILKPKNGRLLIVDLGKPQNVLLRLLIGVYWKFIVPLIALIILRSKGFPYLSIYETYKRLPSNKELKQYLRKRFEYVKFMEIMFGGVIVVVAKGKVS